MDIRETNDRRSISKPVILFASIFIGLWVLHFMTPIILPLLFAVLIAIIFTPLMFWFVKKGCGNTSALVLTTISMIMLLAGLIATVGYSFSRLIASTPEYSESIGMQMARLSDQISQAQMDILDTYVLSAIDLNQIVGFAAGIGASITEGIIIGCIIVVLAIFVLHEILTLPSRYKGEGCFIPQAASRVSTLFAQLIDYMVVRTKINLFTGFGTMVGLYIIGIDFAYLWGICAFILAYIPYIGFTISLIPAAILGFIQFGITGVLLVIIIFSVVNLLTDVFLFPYVASADLNLSPFIVFTSVFFWAFILGPFSSLIAVPITMGIKIFLEQYDETKWIAVFMRGNSKKKQRRMEVR
ncbi:MAG: AI-2E family transporter [Methanomicrobiales archaeon]|jgi:predicted PurR-regulated permease PerM|nr:AI-2E family transporter [Methanomicrobiales archaeon]